MPGPLRLPRLNPSRRVSCTNPCTNQLSGQLVPVGQHDRLIPTQRAREHLIRRSGRIVQNRPLWSLRWADIPQLSAWDAPCPAAWQQCWQQLRGPGADPRPYAFQAGHIQSWRGSCECYALLPVAAACRGLLLLLSPLLSAAVARRALGCEQADASASGHPSSPGPASLRAATPPIGLAAAALFAGGEVSRADSRVR
jgi:hypothetical protein